jgi:glutathione S-transferase
MSEPVLVTITFSHFCEKVRWALDRTGIVYRESGHLPLFHMLAVSRAGGWRSVPALVTDEAVINDSTNIMGWIDKRVPDAHLYGRNDAERREIERLEDLCDEQVGPHTRRWAYFYLLPMRDLLLRMTRDGAPKIEHAMLSVLFPVVRTMMRRAMKITPDGAERSRQKIDGAFAEIEKLLVDGRKFSRRREFVRGRYHVCVSGGSRAVARAICCHPSPNRRSSHSGASSHPGLARTSGRSICATNVPRLSPLMLVGVH